MAGTGRDTSVDAYKDIRDKGLISEMQFFIYDCVYNHGPLTVSECFDILETDFALIGMKLNHNTRTRFGELRAMGLLVETGKRACKITGRRVLEFDVTSSLPKPVNKKSKATKYKELLIAVADYLDQSDPAAAKRIRVRLDEIG